MNSSRLRSLFEFLVLGVALIGSHLCCASASVAQEIVGPGEIEAGTLARLSIAWPEGSTSGAAAWIVFPLERGDIEVTDEDGNRAVFTGPAHREPYTILVSAVHEGRPKWLTYRVLVKGSLRPDPDPIDPVDPIDPPEPDLSGLAKIAYEQAKLIGDRAGARTLAAIWESTAAQLAAGAVESQDSLILIRNRSEDELGIAGYERWKPAIREISIAAAAPTPTAIAELAERLRIVAGSLRLFGGQP